MVLDNHYGPDRRVEFQAGMLKRVGFDVRIVAWDRRTQASSGGEPPDPSVELIRIPVPTAPGGGWRAIRGLGKFASRAWLRRRQILQGTDLLVAHDLYMLPLVAMLSRFRGVPYAYDAHEEFAAMEASRYPRGYIAAITRIEERLARGAAFTLVPGTNRLRRWRGTGVDPIVLRNIGSARPSLNGATKPEWDIAYCGQLSEVRRLDVLLDLANERTDLRIVVAGDGRSAPSIEEAAAGLPNLEFRGWTAEPDAILGSSRVVYYGLDPTHPYSDLACPNTLYQALRLGKPLVYFCGGEPAEIAATYKIGVRCDPTWLDVANAVDELRASPDWLQLAEAWAAVANDPEREVFLAAVQSAIDPKPKGV
jgi:glycosyltransferase involved in cell wall biosynthesis